MTTITCKVPATLKARLDALARRRRVSKSVILREALEKTTKGAAKAAAPSAYDFVQHLRGSLRGPRDLSTNPKYLKGFGE